MTTAAAPRRGRGLAAALLAAGAAALLGAAAATVSTPFVMAAVIAAGGAAAIVFSPGAGLVALGLFTVLRIPEVATEFHGAPSLFTPLVVLVAGGLLIRRAHGSDQPEGGLPAAILVGGFLAVAAVSIIASPAAADGIDSLRGIVEDGAVAVLVGLLARTPAHLRRLSWAIIAAGGGMALLSLLQTGIGRPDLSFFGFAQSAVQTIVGDANDVRVSGPVGDPNYYAQWFVLLIPFAVERMWDETTSRMRWLAGMAALLMALTVILTFSRGGALALAAISVLLLVRRRPRGRMIAVTALLCVAAVPLLPRNYLERVSAVGGVTQLSTDTDPSVRSRTAELSAAWTMFSTDPLTGVGFGRFPDEYPEVARDTGIEVRAVGREAHNLYLQFAAEMGIGGILLLGGGVAAIARSLGRSRRRLSAISSRAEGIAFAAAVSLVGYSITSLFLHLDFGRLPWLVVGVALAMPGVAAAEDEERDLALGGMTL